mmetsp:Transcript_16665/g.40486  ORF Transcript_16665/g.40486 Transcript_16665/m.40486 type:complete len:400 (+) Transcript_16665:312-1511(+)|eukprot:CAMPEP_0113454180 /NCGR_PEP_ID=MMETSP0014_2-20120614/7732_1 /TAXON_ID=2857 /ORGANISM="Nitzschia sp." /LENGTH=399 /DNA_ID=CAMNT_0000345581 /DNA_START=205 /DNA_END=1404 /DNA_ORIENTATION=- /assembly_acc=CAM_ASM_000159
MGSSKRKCDEITGEFWSLEGADEDDMDPYSDLVLVVKPTASMTSTTSDGSSNAKATAVSYRVHRSKLGRNSTYFDRLFRGNFREQQAKDRVEIEVDPSIAQHFGTILEFLYNQDKIQFKDFGLDSRGFVDFSSTEEADPAIITVCKLVPLAQGAKFLLIPNLYDHILGHFKAKCDHRSYRKAMTYFVRDMYCWSLAKGLGMDEIEEQILSNLLNFPFHPLMDGMFDLPFLSDLPEKYQIVAGERAKIFEATLIHMEKMHDVMRRKSFSYLALETIRNLPDESVTKSMFDKIVMSPVAVDEGEVIASLERDGKNAVSIILMHERFYPSESTPGDIKLTRMEAKLVKLFLESLKRKSYSPKYVAKVMSRLPNHIISVVATAQVCDDGQNRIDEFVVEEGNE